MAKGKQIYEGKAKILYEGPEKGTLIQYFKDDATAFLTSKGFRVDYAEIAHADTLALLDKWNGTDPVVALIAAYIGDVRLIDNLVLTH